METREALAEAFLEGLDLHTDEERAEAIEQLEQAIAEVEQYGSTSVFCRLWQRDRVWLRGAV